MRIAVVEDEQKTREHITSLISEYLDERGHVGSVASFASAEAFRAAYEPLKFDLILMDVYLSERKQAATGMDLARTVREAKDRVPIVFVTSSRDFAVEGYTVQAAGYLIKPVGKEELVRTLDSIRLPEPFVRIGTGRLPVRVGDVVWCKADGHYVEVHALTETYRVRASFSEAQSALEPYGSFYLSARGYLVNLAFVRGMDQAEFVLRNGMRVPISLRNVADAKAAWSGYLFDKVRGL
ncbi:MAG: LytTR family DNA-binding domain-containing protein [Atopobiaceae bacterium]|jgi:DNA-binding LytR/AlgR family response regulator|nr:LytTR family DNA-binding domain-containing protein [Atopobiaceae bacterium]MCI1388674.1 LytTR family DNA-binding domain-containing protein [Atopobiaceae bacterium]MCI1432706.1 LytTR family DNA-binding domain-containing protein [Atopobiaceae bacterium]MCI1470957.1 LytTR family DNA-binding domain-containing protein [Atopobiaceae bacterium]